VLHIELRRWADVLLFAPLTAHTLAKLALGLCDNLPTNIARAWDSNKPVLVAPAMNTHMWNHPLTADHLVSHLSSSSTFPDNHIDIDDPVFMTTMSAFVSRSGVHFERAELAADSLLLYCVDERATMNRRLHERTAEIADGTVGSRDRSGLQDACLRRRWSRRDG